MKKRYTLLFLALLFSVHTEKLQAAHIIGGYMSYECLGGNNYRFKLVLYRDCFGGGAPFDSGPGAPFPGTISVYAGSATTPITSTVFLDPPVVTNIAIDATTGNCPVTPATLCIEEGIYSFDYTLPQGNDTIHVVYQRCCRSNKPNNILYAGDTGMTFTQTITPEARAVCNSSPYFPHKPMACSVIDLGLLFHSHSMWDKEEDEKVYSFCAPYAGGGSNTANATAPNGVAPDPDSPPPFNEVQFYSPLYSAQQPIPGSPHFQINAESGMVIGRGSILGSYVYGICVDEFRGDTLLSTTRYEFVHTVTGTPLSADGLSDRKSELKIFPNPATDKIYMELPFDRQEYVVEIIDLNGKIWKQDQVGANSERSIGLAGIPNGLYTARAISGDVILTGKFIVLGK